MASRFSQKDLAAILDKGLLQTHSEQRQRIIELERSNAILHTVEDKLSTIEDEMEVLKAELEEKTRLIDSLQKKLGEEREKRRGMGKGVMVWRERCEIYDKRWALIKRLVLEDDDEEEPGEPTDQVKTRASTSRTPVALPFTEPEIPSVTQRSRLLPSSLPRKVVRRATPHTALHPEVVSSPTTALRRPKRTRDDTEHAVRPSASVPSLKSPAGKRTAARPSSPTAATSSTTKARPRKSIPATGENFHVKQEPGTPGGLIMYMRDESMEVEDGADPLAMM